MVREVDLEGEAECDFVGNAYALYCLGSAAK
jgi:hypothetical protein